MVDLVRAGRNPDDLAREFEPSGHSIRAWVAQADRNEGRREEAAPGLTAFGAGTAFIPWYPLAAGRLASPNSSRGYTFRICAA
jgi:hypothetical protein